jgi:hypothetical protein
MGGRPDVAPVSGGSFSHQSGAEAAQRGRPRLSRLATKMAKSSRGAKCSMNSIIRPHSGITGHHAVTIGRQWVMPAELDAGRILCRCDA